MDHTQYLQKMISAGGIVRIPNGDYEVSKSLEIGSDTHLILSPRTVIKLADGANCPILLNKATAEAPSENIILEGGIWDGNNVGQDRAQYQTPYTFGQFICFTYIRDLTIKHTTIKDPNSFGIQLTDTERFTVSDVRFDCNKKTLNQDGLHVNGWAKDGYITNLKGNTNDDFVALNADEGLFASESNDIENIVIDGIYGGDNGWTAVRLLSRDAHVKHIVIKNIFGAYNYNAVSFTHWGNGSLNYGFFDDIMLENIHCSSCRTWGTGHGGLIWFQDGVKNVGKVVVSGFFRTETADKLNDTNTIHIGNGAKIKKLILRDVMQDIPDNKALIYCDPNASVEELKIDGELQKPEEFNKTRL